MTTAAYDRPDGEWSEDGALVQAYLGGDAEAFERLFRRYYPDLVAFLTNRVRGDRPLAEDLAQETMARALRSLGTFDRRYPIWPWLRKIGSNLATAEAFLRGTEIVTPDVPDERTTADAVDALVSRDEVEACLARIPKRQRRALVMRYFDDVDPKVIAELFGLSRTAFEQLMWRARKSFANEYRTRDTGPWLPGFAPLAVRLRRIAATFGARLNAAAGAGFSVAGDIGISAALTVGGVALATGVLHAHAAQPAPYAIPDRPMTYTAARTVYPDATDHAAVVTAVVAGATTQVTHAGTTPVPMPTPSPAPAADAGAVAPPREPSTAPQPSPAQADNQGGVYFTASPDTGDAPVGSTAQASGDPDNLHNDGEPVNYVEVTVTTPVKSVSAGEETTGGGAFDVTCDPIAVTCTSTKT